jgi:hypothetical protein
MSAVGGTGLNNYPAQFSRNFREPEGGKAFEVFGRVYRIED